LGWPDAAKTIPEKAKRTIAKTKPVKIRLVILFIFPSLN
jgi:hypothetical protein